MDESHLSEAVQELINERLHSIEELEAALLLHAHARRWWTVRELSDALRIPEGAADMALQGLVERGLVTSEGGRFQLDSAHQSAMDELSKSYAEHRVEMLIMISTNAISRVRSGALRFFSDAFRLGGKKSDG